MHILLTRKIFGKATIGEMAINGQFRCYTLEDEVRERDGEQPYLWKIKGNTAIPRGCYKLVVSMSLRFKRMLPEVLGVPGFTGIRIHPGNTHRDTEGCILVGKGVGEDYLTDSRAAFDEIYTDILAAHERKEEISIEVV